MPVTCRNAPRPGDPQRQQDVPTDLVAPDDDAQPNGTLSDGALDCNPGSSALLFRRELVWPQLGSVQQAQNADAVSRNGVRRYIWSAHDHQFAGSGYTTRSAARRELNQAADCSNDLLIDMDCCARTIGFDMAEDVITI